MSTSQTTKMSPTIEFFYYASMSRILVAKDTTTFQNIQPHVGYVSFNEARWVYHFVFAQYNPNM
jgi:hypothetical protein